MKIEGLGWLGIRTERFEETARFFREVMGLEETRRERDMVGFAFPDGTEMEVWRPEDEFHSFFGAGPVVGLRVDDVEEARARRPVAEHIGRRRLDLNALLHSLGQGFLTFSLASSGISPQNAPVLSEPRY